MGAKGMGSFETCFGLKSLSSLKVLRSYKVGSVTLFWMSGQALVQKLESNNLQIDFHC